MEWLEVQMGFLVEFTVIEVGMSSIRDKGHYLGLGLTYLQVMFLLLSVWFGLG